jgi:hypothetical protein
MWQTYRTSHYQRQSSNRLISEHNYCATKSAIALLFRHFCVICRILRVILGMSGFPTHGVVAALVINQADRTKLIEILETP